MEQVEKFEHAVSQFYKSPYAIATDCCTHAIELCLRILKPAYVECPTRTYVSIPMTFSKLNIPWNFNNQEWNDYYIISNTNIIDAAVYWRKNGYIENTLMCLSFQFKKHLNLSRGGMILTDNKEIALELKKMSYDGRTPNIPWMTQDISTLGYHYYMTPETAQLGLDKINQAKNTEPKNRSYKDYPDLSQLTVFKNKLFKGNKT